MKRCLLIISSIFLSMYVWAAADSPLIVKSKDIPPVLTACTEGENSELAKFDEFIAINKKNIDHIAKGTSSFAGAYSLLAEKVSKIQEPDKIDENTKATILNSYKRSKCSAAKDFCASNPGAEGRFVLESAEADGLVANLTIITSECKTVFFGN